MALDHFSHHFRSGRFSCLLGPSGCGKSTLIQIVGGLEPATNGRVRIQDPEKPDRQRLLGADSVRVWQNLNLFPWRNVMDNIAFAYDCSGLADRIFVSLFSGNATQRCALLRCMDRPHISGVEAIHSA